MTTTRNPTYDGVTITGTQLSSFPTMPLGDNSTAPATTAFVVGDVAVETARAEIAEGVNATAINAAMAVGLSSRTFIDVMGAPYGAVGDGTHDDTSAIHAAATAASAGNCRYLWFRDGRKFSAPTLDDNICRDTIFLGAGSVLVNIPVLSRKVIIPIGAGGPLVPTGDYVPEIHTPLGSKRAVTVMFIGDSHTTWDVNDVYTGPGLVRKLSEKFQHDNPSTAYTFLNYGIGGTNLANLTMQNADGTSGWLPPYWPDWWPNHSLSWLQTAQAMAPDIVVWVRCTNEVNLTSALLINRCQSILGTFNSWAKPPGHILCIEPARSLRDAQQPNIEEGVQGILRSFARFYNLGILDMARTASMSRDGYDPLRQEPFVSGVANLTPYKTMPITFPAMTRDYGLAFAGSGASGGNAFVEAGGEFQFSTSGAVGDIFRVGVDTGTNCWYFQSDVPATAGGSTALIARTVTNIPAVYPASGRLNLIFQLSGTRVVAHVWDPQLSATQLSIFDGNIVKVGGAFVPKVSCTTANASVVASSLSMASSVLNSPTATDTEMFGLDAGAGPVGTDYYGGDGGIHVSSRLIERVYVPVINATRFAAGGDASGFLRANGIIGEDDYVTLKGQSGSITFVSHGSPGVQRWVYLDNSSSTDGVDFFAGGAAPDVGLRLHGKGLGNVSVHSPLYLPALATSTSYASDSAAAAGGIPLYGSYRNGSAMMVRIA